MEYGPFDIDLSRSISSNRKRGVDWLASHFNLTKKEAGALWDELMDNCNKKLERIYKEWPNVN